MELKDVLGEILIQQGTMVQAEVLYRHLPQDFRDKVTLHEFQMQVADIIRSEHEIGTGGDKGLS